jgi:hypothetical protein
MPLIDIACNCPYRVKSTRELFVGIKETLASSLDVNERLVSAVAHLFFVRYPLPESPYAFNALLQGRFQCFQVTI